MGTPKMTDDMIREAVDLVAMHGSVNAAARASGLPRTTLQSRYYARDKGDYTPAVSFPAFVDHGEEDEPIDDLLGRLEKGFNRKHRNATAKRWFEVKVNETKPYGVLMFGDPHLGDDGCNMPLLQSHLAIARNPGVYGLNIGDTTNNWVGRLMRLYAEQETSAKTGMAGRISRSGLAVGISRLSIGGLNSALPTKPAQKPVWTLRTVGRARLYGTTFTPLSGPLNSVRMPICMSPAILTISGLRIWRSPRRAFHPGWSSFAGTSGMTTMR